MHAAIYVLGLPLALRKTPQTVISKAVCYKTKKRDQRYADLLVRWARLELAQDYSHYPLKVACLPFHHHRLFVLGLQRYDKNLNFQIILQFFSKIFQKK